MLQSSCNASFFRFLQFKFGEAIIFFRNSAVHFLCRINLKHLIIITPCVIQMSFSLTQHIFLKSQFLLANITYGFIFTDLVISTLFFNLLFTFLLSLSLFHLLLFLLQFFLFLLFLFYLSSTSVLSLLLPASKGSTILCSSFRHFYKVLPKTNRNPTAVINFVFTVLHLNQCGYGLFPPRVFTWWVEDDRCPNLLVNLTICKLYLTTIMH